jgi:hypothetical protein
MSKRREPREKWPPFIMVLQETWDAPAWRAMSAGARLLYIALRRRFIHKSHNNGGIFLSSRDAEIELGTAREQIARWYRELQHYGFIVKMSECRRGSRGICPHWRLTDCGYHKEPATRDFLRWDGTLFRPKPIAPRPVSPGKGQAAPIAARGFKSRRATNSHGEKSW